MKPIGNYPAQEKVSQISSIKHSKTTGKKPHTKKNNQYLNTCPNYVKKPRLKFLNFAINYQWNIMQGDNQGRMKNEKEKKSEAANQMASKNSEIKCKIETEKAKNQSKIKRKTRHRLQQNNQTNRHQPDSIEEKSAKRYESYQ